MQNSDSTSRNEKNHFSIKNVAAMKVSGASRGHLIENFTADSNERLKVFVTMPETLNATVFAGTWFSQIEP